MHHGLQWTLKDVSIEVTYDANYAAHGFRGAFFFPKKK